MRDTSDSWYPVLYCIGALALVLLYSGNLGDAFKGEMWELLYISSENLSPVEKLTKVATFVCFGAGRFQPLAFFVPYVQLNFGSAPFVTAHLFALGLHLLGGLAVAMLCKSLSHDRFLAFCAFVAFLFSFLASDVLIWTFFTYIQAHALLIITSVALFFGYLRNNKPTLLILSWISALLSALLYEAGIAALLAQPAFSVLSLRFLSRRHFVLELVCPLLLLAAYLGGGLLMMSLEFRDSTAQLHPMTFAKVFTYFMYFVRYNSGFTSVANIYNIGSLTGLELPVNVWTFVGLGIFGAWIVTLVRILIRGRMRLSPRIAPELSFVTILLFGYVLLIAFGRVPKGIGLFTPSGLETQFRYYYVATALVPVVVVLAVAAAGQRAYPRVPFVLMLAFMLIGNGYNIVRFGHETSVATASLTAHALRIASDLSGEQDAQREFVRRMHRDWYMETIATPKQFWPYTYNANRCKVHPQYAALVHAAPALIVMQSGPPVGTTHAAALREIDLRGYTISDTNSDPSWNARAAATGTGIWHVKLDPQPPQTVSMEVDFGPAESKRVVALAFIPRQGHPAQFWDDAELLGSSDGINWERIVDLRLTAPPAEAWFTIRFANENSYRYYRFFIKSGFASGRFLTLGGVKMYEAEARNQP